MRSTDAAGDASAPHRAGAALGAHRTWTAARDAVLRGLVHALSNRVGTVVAVGGLLEHGSGALAATVLGGESERLETLVQQFRLVTADPFGDAVAPEPVLVPDACADAIALHALAGDGRERVISTAYEEALPPALVSRAGLLHALLVLLAAGDAPAVLWARADGGELRLWVEPPAPGPALDAAAWLTAGSGVRASADGALLLPCFGAAAR